MYIMSDLPANVSNFIDELQNNSNTRDEKEFVLNKEDLEQFLLNKSGKLIKNSLDYIQEIGNYITSAPDSKDIEALAKLIGTSASAVESLNKIHINDEKNKTAKNIKEMDIESKKQLQQSDHAVLLLNREELLNKLLDNAKETEGEVIDASYEVVTPDSAENQ